MPLLPYAAPGHVRSRLLRDLILLVLATMALLVGVSALLLQVLNRDLAESRIGAATLQVRDEVRNLLGPVEQQLLILRDGLRSADLTPADAAALDRRLVPSLTHIPQIAGALLALDTGAEWFLSRDGEAWLVRERGPGRVDQAQVTRLSPTGERLETGEEPLDYDPRTRPWYSGAVAARDGGPTWSAPYSFHTLGVPGITASVAWKAAGQTRVLALDVTLGRITAAIEALDLGDGGRGFLFRGDLRTNLHTGKPGKEIELAWLKGVAAFLNTEGGILLLGVADDGAVLGLAVDAFDNDDKLRLHFKNLLHHHIGPEYTRLVRLELYRLDDQQVAAVECERAAAPVFLRNGNSESFLIRSGPSNLDLPLSKAIRYIRGRF